MLLIASGSRALSITIVPAAPGDRGPGSNHGDGAVMKKEVLTTGQLHELRESGFVVLRGFYDLEGDIVPVQRGVHQVVGQVMARNGHPDSRREFLPERFDEGYLDLCRANRAWGG